MLKQLSLMLVLSPLLVACGGGGGDNEKPLVVVTKSTSSSSAPASSKASSSSSVDTSNASSSSSGPVVIDVDMTTWRGNSDGVVDLNNEGVMFTASADGQGAVFDLKGVNLKGAVIDFLINVSPEYEASGANLQPFAQVKIEGYPGEYGCWVNNSDLTKGVDQTVSCSITAADFDQTAADVQIGLQAKGTTVSGTILIKSVKVTLPAGVAGPVQSSSLSSSSSSMSSAPSGVYIFPDASSLTSWAVNGGGSPNQLQLEFNTAGGSGINMVPIDWAANAGTAYKYEARFTLPAPVDLTAGKKIIYTLSIPQSYITDATAALQSVWGGDQYSDGTDGGYRSLKASEGVSSSTDFVMTETIPSSKAKLGATTIGLQIAAAPTDTTIKDKILIKSIKIE